GREADIRHRLEQVAAHRAALDRARPIGSDLVAEPDLHAEVSRYVVDVGRGKGDDLVDRWLPTQQVSQGRRPRRDLGQAGAPGRRNVQVLRVALRGGPGAQ